MLYFLHGYKVKKAKKTTQHIPDPAIQRALAMPKEQRAMKRTYHSRKGNPFSMNAADIAYYKTPYIQK